MFHVILYEPEIPPNTGNIIRLCANTGSHLHLIEPLGFVWDDKRLRRAGLDYHAFAAVKRYPDLAECLQQFDSERVFALSTKGKQRYASVEFAPGDALLFGPETRGLPDAVLAQFPPPQVLRLPMQDNSRSLNLSNVVAVVLFEAWRQCEFAGGD